MTFCELVEEQPDITLVEIGERLIVERSISAVPSTTWLFFERRGIPFKKTAHATEQEREDVMVAREAWFNGQIDLAPECRTFLDETGAKMNMARIRGQAKRQGRMLQPIIPARMRLCQSRRNLWPKCSGTSALVPRLQWAPASCQGKRKGNHPLTRLGCEQRHEIPQPAALIVVNREISVR